MIETVVVLPFIMVVIALIIFGGKAMLQVQRTESLARYEAWREAARADDALSSLHTDRLNEAFYRNRADDVDIEMDRHFPDDAEDLWEDAIYDHEGAGDPELLDSTASYFNSVIGRNAGRRGDRFTTGRRITAEFTGPVGPSGSVGGTDEVTRTHLRIGHEWKYVNDITGSTDDGAPLYSGTHSHNGDILTQMFYQDFEAIVGQPQYDDNRIIQTMRNYYLQEQGYHGPYIP